MNIIFDLLIVSIIVICALIGRKKGFIVTFFGFFGSLISFVLSSILARPVGIFLGENIMEPMIRRYFIDSFLETINSQIHATEFSSLPEACKELLLRFQFGESELQTFLADTEETGMQALEKLADTIAPPIAASLGNAVALFILFIVISLILRALVKILDLVSKLPGLNFSNRLLGLLAGIAWGVLLAVVLSSLAVLVEPVLQGSGNALLQSFDSDKTFLVRIFSALDIFKSVFE